MWRPAGKPSGHFAVRMDRYARTPKRDFKLYPRWPQLCGFGCDWHAGVESEFDRLIDEEKSALTISERNAVGGKIEASE